MTSAKGYHSYRGRPSKLKIFLAILLCLVILAAVALIFLQEHIVFDEQGLPHLQIPWELEEPSPPAPPEITPPEEEPVLDLVIVEPPGPPAVRAFSVPEGTVTRDSWDSAERVLPDGTACDAVAVTLKDADGTIYFDSAAGVKKSVKQAEDTEEVLAEITGERFYSIARISCLLDPLASRTDVAGMGLKNTGGYIFYDLRSHTWLDPAKEGAVEYLSALAVEAAALGFDEILLTGVSYPTEGKINKIAYTGEEALGDNIAAFLQAMGAALEPYDLRLSIELPEAVVAGEPDEVAGLDLTQIAPLVDRIYAATTEDRVEALTEAVTAVDETTGFVPELTEPAPDLEAFLLLPRK